MDAPVSITGSQLRQLRIEVDNLNLIMNKPVFGIRPSEKQTKIFKEEKFIKDYNFHFLGSIIFPLLIINLLGTFNLPFFKAR